MTEKDVYYFEHLGKDFDAFMSDYDVQRRVRLIFDHLLSPISLPENPAVLEVGCGTGRVSQHLRPLTGNLTVNDVSSKLTDAVAKRLKCHALPGDCSALSERGGSFDLIVSSECIEHTPAPYAALTGMSRILKDGGWLVVTTPNKCWYPVLLAARLMKIRKFSGIENWTWPRITGRWLREQRFQNIFFSGCHLFPWQIPFSKSILPVFDRYGSCLYPLMINYGFSAQKNDPRS